jgi:hypothetical protein
VENLSALEYGNGEWLIYRHVVPANHESESNEEDDTGNLLLDMDNKEIFQMVMKEFQV